MRKGSREVLPALALALAIGAPPLSRPTPAVAQMTVVQITRGTTRVATADEVLWTQIGELAGRPVSEGDLLGVDDEIRSTSGEVLVTLSCGPEVTFNLSGSFRVMVLPPEGQMVCYLSLLGGRADIVGNGNTGVRSGLLRAGAPGTQYTVELLRGGVESAHMVAVYEGEVRLSSGVAGQGREPVQQVARGGTAVRIRGSDMSQGPMPESLLSSTAERFARIALGSQPAIGPEQQGAAYQTLRRDYAAALSRGGADEAVRMQLAVTLADFDVHSADRLYQTKAAGGADTLAGPRAATVTWLKGAAWAALGDSATARALVERANRMDPDVGRLMRDRYRLRPDVIQRVQRPPR